MKWKCTNCGNKISTAPPVKCQIDCCGETNSYVVDNTPGDLLKAKWKCTNCGNQTGVPTMPTTCEISCCDATNSYVPID
jgi:hypothetical protein